MQNEARTDAKRRKLLTLPLFNEDLLHPIRELFPSDASPDQVEKACFAKVVQARLQVWLKATLVNHPYLVSEGLDRVTQIMEEGMNYLGRRHLALKTLRSHFGSKFTCVNFEPRSRREIGECSDIESDIEARHRKMVSGQERGGGGMVTDSRRALLTCYGYCTAATVVCLFFFFLLFSTRFVLFAVTVTGGVRAQLDPSVLRDSGSIGRSDAYR